MSEETLKCHCINLHQILNSDWHETGIYNKWILLESVPPESSAFNILKCIFQMNYLNLFECCHHV